MNTDYDGLSRHRANARLWLGLGEACLRALQAMGEGVEAILARRADPLGHGILTEEALRALLAVRPYAPATVAKYVFCVNRFLGGRRKVELEDLRDDDVAAYLDELRAGGAGNAVLRLNLSALRTVFDRLLGLGITRGLGYAPRPPKGDPATPEQVHKLRGACTTDQERRILDGLHVEELRVGQLSQCRIGEPPHTRWLLPSSRCKGRALTPRAIRGNVARLCARCGVSATTTAIRKAPKAEPGHASGRGAG